MIDFTPVATGTYYLVVVNSRDGQTGSYLLNGGISTGGAGAWPLSGTATLGLNATASTGTLDETGNQFKVSLTAGTTYNIVARTPVEAETDLTLRLYNSSALTATRIAEATATDGATWSEVTMSYWASVTGTYYIDVTDQDTANTTTYGQAYTIEAAPANYVAVLPTLAIAVAAQTSLAEGNSSGGTTPFVFNVARNGTSRCNILGDGEVRGDGDHRRRRPAQTRPTSAARCRPAP